jgi:hypothetical protein
MMRRVFRLYEKGKLADIHSGDECETNAVHGKRLERYVACTICWRNDEELVPFMQGLETLHMSTHFKSGTNQLLRGNRPHIKVRIHGRHMRDEEAPQGLPENFYNPKYLEMRRRNGDLDKLKVAKPLKLEFSAAVQEYESLNSWFSRIADSFAYRIIKKYTDILRNRNWI